MAFASELYGKSRAASCRRAALVGAVPVHVRRGRRRTGPAARWPTGATGRPGRRSATPAARSSGLPPQRSWGGGAVIRVGEVMGFRTDAQTAFRPPHLASPTQSVGEEMSRGHGFSPDDDPHRAVVQRGLVIGDAGDAGGHQGAADRGGDGAADGRLPGRAARSPRPFAATAGPRPSASTAVRRRRPARCRSGLHGLHHLRRQGPGLAVGVRREHLEPGVGEPAAPPRQGWPARAGPRSRSASRRASARAISRPPPIAITAQITPTARFMARPQRREMNRATSPAAPTASRRMPRPSRIQGWKSVIGGGCFSEAARPACK